MTTKLIKDKGITRLGISVIVAASLALAGLLGYVSISHDETGVIAYAGPENNGTLQLRGAVLAQSAPTQECAGEIVFMVSLADGAEPVNFTMTEDSNANGILSDEVLAPHTTLISYIDTKQVINDLTWRVDEYGPGNGDTLLEAGETFRITIGADKNGHEGLLATALNPKLGVLTPFTIEVRTPNGEVFSIERTTPDSLTPVMNLR